MQHKESKHEDTTASCGLEPRQEARVDYAQAVLRFPPLRKIVDKKKKSVRWELPDSRDLEENSDPKVRFLQPIVRSTLSSRRPIDRGSHHHRIPTSASNVGLKEKVTQKWEQEVDEDRRALEHLWNEIVQTPRHYTPQEAQVRSTTPLAEAAAIGSGGTNSSLPVNEEERKLEEQGEEGVSRAVSSLNVVGEGQDSESEHSVAEAEGESGHVDHDEDVPYGVMRLPLAAVRKQHGEDEDDDKDGAVSDDEWDTSPYNPSVPRPLIMKTCLQALGRKKAGWLVPHPDQEEVPLRYDLSCFVPMGTFQLCHPEAETTGTADERADGVLLPWAPGLIQGNWLASEGPSAGGSCSICGNVVHFRSLTFAEARSSALIDVEVISVFCQLEHDCPSVTPHGFVAAINRMYSRYKYGYSEINALESPIFREVVCEYSRLIESLEYIVHGVPACRICSTKGARGIHVDAIKKMLRWIKGRDAKDNPYWSDLVLASTEDWLCTTQDLSEPTNTERKHFGNVCDGNWKATQAAIRADSKVDIQGLSVAVCPHLKCLGCVNVERGEQAKHTSYLLHRIPSFDPTFSVLISDVACMISNLVTSQLCTLSAGQIKQILTCIPSFHVNKHEWYCKVLESPQMIAFLIAHEFAEQYFAKFHRAAFRSRNMNRGKRADFITKYHMIESWDDFTILHQMKQRVRYYFDDVKSMFKEFVASIKWRPATSSKHNLPLAAVLSHYDVTDAPTWATLASGFPTRSRVAKEVEHLKSLSRKRGFKTAYKSILEIVHRLEAHDKEYLELTQEVWRVSGTGSDDRDNADTPGGGEEKQSERAHLASTGGHVGSGSVRIINILTQAGDTSSAEALLSSETADTKEFIKKKLLELRLVAKDLSSRFSTGPRGVFRPVTLAVEKAAKEMTQRRAGRHGGPSTEPATLLQSLPKTALSHLLAVLKLHFSENVVKVLALQHSALSATIFRLRQAVGKVAMDSSDRTRIRQQLTRLKADRKKAREVLMFFDPYHVSSFAIVGPRSASGLPAGSRTGGWTLRQPEHTIDTGQAGRGQEVSIPDDAVGSESPPAEPTDPECSDTEDGDDLEGIFSGVAVKGLQPLLKAERFVRSVEVIAVLMDDISSLAGFHTQMIEHRLVARPRANGSERTVNSATGSSSESGNPERCPWEPADLSPVGLEGPQAVSDSDMGPLPDYHDRPQATFGTQGGSGTPAGGLSRQPHLISSLLRQAAPYGPALRRSKYHAMEALLAPESRYDISMDSIQSEEIVARGVLALQDIKQSRSQFILDILDEIKEECRVAQSQMQQVLEMPVMNRALEIAKFIVEQ